MVVLAATARVPHALAQQSSVSGDLGDLSIEELMNESVTSVSKREQKLSQAAAALFVINQEDIRQSGALNIPDVLRMVPGLDVAQINANTWAISARGFNHQFSDKLRRSTQRLEWSLVGQNLLQNRHVESNDLVTSVNPTQVKRSVYAKFTWTF